MSVRAWILVALTTLVWGITPVIERKVMPGTDLLAGLTYRNTFSALLLIIAAVVMGKLTTVWTLTTSQYIGLSASAILGGTVGLGLFFAALKIAPASRIIPLTATFPMVTYVLSIWLLKEPFTFKGFLGVLFIILGAWMLA